MKNEIPVVSVGNPEAVYDEKKRLVGHSVTVLYRLERYYSYATGAEQERIECNNQAAELFRSVVSQGYSLKGDPDYTYYPRGVQVIAKFTREHRFKNGLFVDSYKRATRFVSKMREVVLHPGRYDV